MSRSLLLLLLALTLLCQGQTAVADAMLAVSDANPALMRKPTVHLELGKVTSLPGHAELAVELRSYTVESIEASPDDPESSPAGSGVTIEVLIAGFPYSFSALSEGYTSQEVAWSSDFKVTLLGHDSQVPAVDLLVEEITDETQAELQAEVTLTPGQSVVVEGDLELTFSHHGHKRTHVGQKSPLVVGINYRQGSTVQQRSYSLFPPDRSSWRYCNYEFNIVRYQYQKSMVLSVRSLRLKAL